MENFTAISVHACYLTAVVVFLIAAGIRYFSGLSRDAYDVPDLPGGKVQVWFYLPADLLGLGLFTFVFYGLASLGASMSDEAASVSLNGLLVGIGLQFLLVMIAAAIVLRRVGPIQWLGLVWRDWVKVLGIAPLCVLGMFAFSVALYFLGYMDLLKSLDLAKEQEAVTLFREGKDIGLLLVMGFAAVIVAPFCEEVVFRGYLYPVAKKFGGTWVAAFFSALVFAAAHGNVAAMLPLFVFGLVLVAVYEWTGSIWAPVAVHFLFNGSTVVIQYLARFAELPENVMR